MNPIETILHDQKVLIIADEPDNTYAIAKALQEVGSTCEAYIAQRSEIQEAFTCKMQIGDFEEVEKRLPQADMLITNYHGERLAHKYHKAFLVRGFPNYEQVGIGLRYNILYEGSCNFLCEVNNLLVNQYEAKTKIF